MIDDNVVAFYCSNCHKTVWNYEHNFEQLHEKGLCAKCLRKQNKTKDKWQKLKEWLKVEHDYYLDENYQDCAFSVKEVLDKMQELEGEDE